MLWGLSPALDLISEYEKVNALYGLKEINILLLGSTDARHILKTVSALKRHPLDETTINFFVMDQVMELVARQLLLLTIALEPEDRLGPEEKARLWMEVYGNTLLRPGTAKYVISKAAQLIYMVTNKDFQKKRLPLVDLEQVKYKEIDQMENIFKYWIRNRDSILKIWDVKVRRFLGARYDAKNGVFDWDYNMKLREIEGGKRICLQEYKMWRDTGIAFTWLETEYSVGNPTLAVGICSSGDSLYSYGYLGDMESGPYFAFGTDSEEQPMLEQRQGHPVRRATDITERNLQRMFHELEHGSPPSDLYRASVDMGLVTVKPASIDFDKEVQLDFEPDRTPEDYAAIPAPNCKVYFLPSNAMETFPKKAKYKEFFDVVYVAHNFFKFLNAGIMSMAKPNGCLVVETRKFVIALHKQIGKFGKEVKDKLKEVGWEEIAEYHYKREDHVVCKKGQTPTKKNVPKTQANNEMKTTLENGETGSIVEKPTVQEHEPEIEKYRLDIVKQKEVDACTSNESKCHTDDMGETIPDEGKEVSVSMNESGNESNTPECGKKVEDQQSLEGVTTAGEDLSETKGGEPKTDGVTECTARTGCIGNKYQLDVVEQKEADLSSISESKCNTGSDNETIPGEGKEVSVSVNEIGDESNTPKCEKTVPVPTILEEKINAGDVLPERNEEKQKTDGVIDRNNDIEKIGQLDIAEEKEFDTNLSSEAKRNNVLVTITVLEETKEISVSINNTRNKSNQLECEKGAEVRPSLEKDSSSESLSEPRGEEDKTNSVTGSGRDDESKIRPSTLETGENNRKNVTDSEMECLSEKLQACKIQECSVTGDSQ